MAKKKAKLKRGDAVVWQSSQGRIEGKVVKRVAEPLEIQGHHVAASEEHPEYVVRSDKTGAVAAHKPESLRKRSSPK